MGINEFLYTENIKPVNEHVDDFFSHRLHRYAITFPIACQVFIIHSEKNEDDRFVVMGQKSEDGVIGVPLQDLLCPDNSRVEFSTFYSHCVINEITTTFWGHYQLHGGCMLNEHFHSHETQDNPCRYCGNTKNEIIDFSTVPFIKEIRHVRAQ